MAFCRTFSGVAAVIGLVAITAGTACTDEDLDSPFIPLSRFSKAYAQALCGSLQHCCNDNQVKFDSASCTAGWKAVVDGLIANPYLAGNYTPQQGTQCVNEVIAAQGTTCDPLPGSISAARDACQQVFIGRKAVGELCSSPLECAPVADSIVTCQGFPIPNPDKGLLPLVDAIGGSSSTYGAELHLAVIPSQRTCVAYSTDTETDTSCATADLKAICERNANAFCDPADQQCKTRNDVGSECTVDDACKAGFYCANKVCSPGQGSGNPCTSSTQCDSTTGYCDISAGSCADKRRPGDACARDEECSVGVCDLQTKRCLKNGIATTEACNGTDPTTVARQ